MRITLTLAAMLAVGAIGCVGGQPFDLEESCPAHVLSFDTIVANEHPDTTEADVATEVDPYRCPAAFVGFNRVVQRRDTAR